jgi:DNA-binding MarR family transcriptional regulator
MTQTTPERAAPAVQCLPPQRAAAWLGLLKAHGQLVRALDADLAARHRLSLRSLEVLSRLEHAVEGHLRMSELAEQALLSQSRASRLVGELERDGLVARAACPGDSRVVHVRITDAGRARLAEAQCTHFAALEERFFDRCSPEELRLLADIWRRVSEPA